MCGGTNTTEILNIFQAGGHESAQCFHESPEMDQRAGLKLAESDVLGRRAGLKLGPETRRCTGGISEKKYI